MNALARLKAMTNRHSHRLEGRELEKAICTATMLKLEAERQLREIERELRFLESKPATLRDGWKLPDAMPVCPNCRCSMTAAANFDCGELWLEWLCTRCDEEFVEPQIDWPWNEDYVWAIDAAAAGFKLI